MSDTDRTAWAQFWADQKGGPGGCLPQGVAGIQAVQGQVWRQFASSLPRRADVLDVATGDGAVPKMLLAGRPGLKIVGVDSAPVLPPPPKGVIFKAGILAEQLPLAARRFDAVTSQFGYEYSDTAMTAAEVARVLRPGGSIRFIMHHADGPILRHNRSRREALTWVLSGGARLAEARQLAQARASVPIPTPAAFADAVEEAKRLFPQQPVAQEFTLAVRQCLDFGRHTPPRETLAALDDLEKKARNEVARIQSLERAVCDSERIGRMKGELEAERFRIEPPTSLHERAGQAPFAWLFAGVKQPDN